MSQLKEAVGRAEHVGSDDSSYFSFTHEEEADPEICFMPYVWGGGGVCHNCNQY